MRIERIGPNVKRTSFLRVIEEMEELAIHL